MTVITAGEHPSARVWLDGEEVSDLCTQADPELGVVWLIAFDDEGHAQADEKGDVKTEAVAGRVRVLIGGTLRCSSYAPDDD